jgi:predicted RNA polymerase sigma factor
MLRNASNCSLVRFTENANWFSILTRCVRDMIAAAWSKGYARKGAALQGLSRLEEAIIAYDHAIDKENNPAAQAELQKKMEECNAALKQ